MKTRNTLIAMLGIVALALPATAAGVPGADKPEKPEKPDKPGKGKAKTVAYVFDGTYVGDGVSVTVDHGNKHVKKAELVGTDVQFDFTATKVTVADVNADGTADLTDVGAGDEVHVKAKLPKGDPGVQPYAAKHLVDKTNAPAEEPAA
jgi:hypothetical protein